MESKDRIAAANALVGWFNSQEIAPTDAKAIMSKVLAKLMVPTRPTGPHEMDNIFDDFLLQLTHDINDRLHHVRRK